MPVLAPFYIYLCTFLDPFVSLCTAARLSGKISLNFNLTIMAIFFRFVVVQKQQWWYFWNFLYISQWEGIIGTIYLYIYYIIDSHFSKAASPKQNICYAWDKLCVGVYFDRRVLLWYSSIVVCMEKLGS